jgi:hypothetical protein
MTSTQLKQFGLKSFVVKELIVVHMALVHGLSYLRKVVTGMKILFMDHGTDDTF